MGEITIEDVAALETLEAAYDRASSYLEEMQDDPEEWTINLQNHLLWRSYEAGEDADADAVVLEAISLAAKAAGVPIRNIGGAVREILDYLTLV